MAIVFASAVGASAAQALRNSLTRALSVDQQYQVRAQGCTLRASVAAADRYVLRCPGGKVNNRSGVIGVDRAILHAQQRASIRANGCTLTEFSSGRRSVTLRCLSLTPTATPTVTPTPIVSTTPTPDSNALIRSNVLRALNSTRPDAVSTALAITGVAAGDELVSMDRRPQNGALCAVGYNAGAGTVQLYAISSQTGVATALGSSGTFVDASATSLRVGVDASTTFSVDFNPTVDRLRVITRNGQNFRVNPNSGAFVDGDSGVTGTQRDGDINGLTTTVQQVAYTSNVQDTSTTTLYPIDQVTGRLFIQNPANAGTQRAGVTITSPFTAVTAFDIPPGVDVAAPNTPASGRGFAVVTQPGSTASVFTNIDLTTGALTGSTVMGPDVTGVVGVSVLKPAAIPMLALSASGTELVRFRSGSPRTIAAVSLAGMGEWVKLPGQSGLRDTAGWRCRQFGCSDRLHAQRELSSRRRHGLHQELRRSDDHGAVHARRG